MEWFRRPDGSVAVSEAGARPPGAQITSMLCYAHDFDLYSAWAKLMTDGTFGPPERKWAAGTVYLRGQGAGQVQAVHGLDALPPAVAALVVDARLPRAGQPSSGSSEGDGYITIRRPDTEVVTAALQTLVSTGGVGLGRPGLTVGQTVPFGDKGRMKQLLDAAGLRTPWHVAARTVADVWAAAERVGYPLIVKPIDGAGSADTYRADSAVELDAIL